MQLILRRELTSEMLFEFLHNRERWNQMVVLMDEKTPFPLVRSAKEVAEVFDSLPLTYEMRRYLGYASNARQVLRWSTEAVARCIDIEFGGRRLPLYRWEGRYENVKSGIIWNRLRKGASISEALGIQQRTVKAVPVPKQQEEQEPHPKRDSPSSLVNRAVTLMQMGTAYLNQALKMMPEDEGIGR